MNIIWAVLKINQTYWYSIFIAMTKSSSSAMTTCVHCPILRQEDTMKFVYYHLNSEGKNV